MATRTAILDDFALPYNVNSLKYGYKLNVSSTDTLGGRVTQLLSVKFTMLEIKADAGSSWMLLAIAAKVKGIMNKHVETQRPVRLLIPSRGWSFDVYVQSMPGIGWDPRVVTFPYQLRCEIDQDYGNLSKIVMRNELKRLAAGIGYDPKWHGGGVTTLNNG